MQTALKELLHKYCCQNFSGQFLLLNSGATKIEGGLATNFFAASLSMDNVKNIYIYVYKL